MIYLTSNENLLEDYRDCHKCEVKVKKTATPMPPSPPPESVSSGRNNAFLCMKSATSSCVKARNSFSASAYKSAREMRTALSSTTSRVSQKTKKRKGCAKQSTPRLGSDTTHHSLRRMKVLQLHVKRLDVGHLRSKEHL